MRRTMLICCMVALAVAVAGCGVLVNRTAECRNEAPVTTIHDFFWTVAAAPPPPSTKAQFLASWGKPDRTLLQGGNGETWIYRRRLWCGAIPVLVVPLPLVLPVCDGYDNITFQGDLAQRLETRHTVTRGFMFPPGLPADPPCRQPIPFAPAFVEDKVPAVSGLVVLYMPGLLTADYRTVEMDGSYVASLRGSTYYPFLAPPGDRQLSVTEGGEGPVRLAVLPGQTYYVRLQGTGSGRTALRLVQPEVAKDEMRDSVLLDLP